MTPRAYDIAYQCLSVAVQRGISDPDHEFASITFKI
jgi:hypothetical protein